jgi:beta-phosphoglucomutase-like phosphatase (HAD superfamily)
MPMIDADLRRCTAGLLPGPTELTTILCDADGTLFPSEEPAFVASAVVTQNFANHFGLSGDFSAERLRIATTGQNFRTTARALLDEARIDVPDRELEIWVDRERVAVTEHLARVLTPHPDVLAAVAGLAAVYQLAAVSSSALSRLRACFRATGLARAFPPERTFSAESSLPIPTSKPDPAIYRFALRMLDLDPWATLAIEDSASGASSAVAAGIRTYGLVQFVPPAERQHRIDRLDAAGCEYVATSWPALVDRISRCVVKP